MGLHPFSRYSGDYGSIRERFRDHAIRADHAVFSQSCPGQYADIDANPGAVTDEYRFGYGRSLPHNRFFGVPELMIVIRYETSGRDEDMVPYFHPILHGNDGVGADAGVLTDTKCGAWFYRKNGVSLDDDARLNLDVSDR